MNTLQPSTADAGAAQVASQPASPNQQIKPALDVHATTIVVARMVDGAKSQPPGFPCSNDPRSLTLPTENVVAMYEAGYELGWTN